MRRRMFLSCLMALAAVCSAAELKVAPLFRTHMILQRDRVIPVTGTADPGATVTLDFKGKKYSAAADKDGKWLIELPPMPADSKPANMLFKCGKQRKLYTNIVVGEVWRLMGQSHAATGFSYKLSELRGYDLTYKTPKATCDALTKEINDLLQNDPEDQLLRSGTVWSDGSVTWRTCNRKDMKFFSVFAYFMGKTLRKELNIPVGIVQMGRGSSSIESWIPAEYYDHPVLLSEKANIGKYVDFRNAFRAKKLTEAQVDEFLIEYCKDPKRRAESFIRTGKIKPEHRKGVLFRVNAVMPTASYLGTVPHTTPFPVRGMFWWQGETNYYQPADDYRQKLGILFSAYRKLWDPQIPILVIMQGQRKRYANLYSKIRLAQYQAINEADNVYFVNNLMTPQPEINLVHPYHDKVNSGRDAALLALKHIYGKKDSIGSGPVFESAVVKGGNIEVSFRCAKGLKTSDGKAPVGFELAGKDKKYYPAQAKISGDKVIVSSAKVSAPAYVRFMWEDEKNYCNLMNAENLSALPFDTQFEFFQKPNNINK